MDLMTVIAWLVLGLIAGLVAGMLMGGKRGLMGSIIVGVLGAFIGGWLGSMLFGTGVSGFNLTSILLAILGAVVLLAILRMIPGRQPLE